LNQLRTTTIWRKTESAEMPAHENQTTEQAADTSTLAPEPGKIKDITIVRTVVGGTTGYQA
jgi:hypothetical protein